MCSVTRHRGGWSTPANRVLTVVATPGATVQRGQTVYQIDGAPVLVLHGSRPVWREFAAGMPPGQDVRQLEEYLAALGFAVSTVDGWLTSATEAPVRAWQRRQGHPVTEPVTRKRSRERERAGASRDHHSDRKPNHFRTVSRRVRSDRGALLVLPPVGFPGPPPEPGVPHY